MAAAKKAQQEMYGALLTKREELVDTLEKKLTAYKDLLLKEMVRIANSISCLLYGGVYLLGFVLFYFHPISLFFYIHLSVSILFHWLHDDTFNLHTSLCHVY